MRKICHQIRQIHCLLFITLPDGCNNIVKVAKCSESVFTEDSLICSAGLSDVRECLSAVVYKINTEYVAPSRLDKHTAGETELGLI